MQPSRSSDFATTQWSLVLDAGRRNSPDAEAALAGLCSVYWFPLYAFARRRGASREDAADQTQEFFSRLIERSFLQTADPERGRFRVFLLTLFQRFLINEYHRSQTQRRGGAVSHVPIDFDSGEVRYAESVSDQQSPEKIFERHWALTLLHRVMDQLHTEYRAKGKEMLFERCRDFLASPREAERYAKISAELGISEGALRVAVHRMRERYRELLRLEVGGTLLDETQVDDEINSLRRSLQGD